MRNDALQEEPQDAVNDCHLRRKILREISCGDTSGTYRRLHPALSYDEDVDGGNRHPFRDLNPTNLALRLDSLFNHRWLTGLGNNRKSPAQPALNPACDFLESPHEYMVTAHLPDVGQDQVIVVVNGSVLTISAELSNDFEENNAEKHFHRVTSQHSSFLLNFTLPENVAGDEASMEFKGDLLIIHLPKREKSRSPMIDVEAH